MAGVMTPEISYWHTDLLWFPWRLSSTVTMSIPVFSVSGWMLVIVIATAVHRFVSEKCMFCDLSVFLRSGRFV